MQEKTGEAEASPKNQNSTVSGAALKEQKVAAVPGTAFGACGEGYLRCCYATAQNLLEQACDKMARFCESLK